MITTFLFSQTSKLKLKQKMMPENIYDKNFI